MSNSCKCRLNIHLMFILFRTTDKSFDSQNSYTRTSNVNIIGGIDNKIDESHKIIPHITDFYPEGTYSASLYFYYNI